MTLYDFRISVLSEPFLLLAYPKPKLDTKKKHIPKTHELEKNEQHFVKDAEKENVKNKIRKDITYFCPISPDNPS